MYYNYIVPITIIIINMNVLTIITHQTNILEKRFLLFCYYKNTNRRYYYLNYLFLYFFYFLNKNRVFTICNIYIQQ